MLLTRQLKNIATRLAQLGDVPRQLAELSSAVEGLDQRLTDSSQVQRQYRSDSIGRGPVGTGTVTAAPVITNCGDSGYVDTGTQLLLGMR